VWVGDRGMHRYYGRSLTLFVTTLMALGPTTSIADTGIGSATAVANQVEGVVSGQTQTLSSGSAIYTDELVRTGQDGIAELGFVDSTKLSVGPISEIRLDKFVYNPDKAAGSVVLQATRGSYRFVTGVQDHQSYQIKTPYATLGVRGTVVEFDLREARNEIFYKAPKQAEGPCPGGYEKVKLVEGAFTATNKSGKTVEITEPNTVLTVCANGAFSTAQVSESILNFTPLNVAAVPVPGLVFAAAVAAAAAAAAAIALSHHEEPVSPN
jgi:hypothetical protein